MKNTNAAFLIILFTVAVSAIGGLATTAMGEWYTNLILPPFAPGGEVIGPIWTVLYVFAAWSAVRAWQRVPVAKRKKVFSTFALNALFNVAWSFIFFRFHLVELAILDAALIGLTVAMLIGMLYKHDRAAAWLLVPYLAWVIFATYLTAQISLLN